jgi:pimeloyl-ACP methyl ester carboxylesterase
MVEDSRRTSRIVAGAAIVVGAAAVASILSLASLSVYVARTVITPSKRRVQDIRIFGVTESTVTISATSDTVVPGRYSLWFSRGTGHAKIGQIIEQNSVSVTRELLAVDYGDLARAKRGYLAGWFYLSPEELEVPYREVLIDSPVGPAPAWFVPAAEGSGRWLIAAHGRGVRRQECLRVIPVARRCGYTSLLVSYRNDGDAPSSEDGRFGLGDTEWPDIEAAIDYAVANGATEVVLMGWSMGGAIVLQTATRARNASLITGLILESPVINWFETLGYQAEALHVPKPVGFVATELISRSWSGRLTGQAEPIALDRLDFVTRAAELTIPVLLLHSVDDGFVPAGSSRALAAARPDIVSYDEFSIARHVKLWNYDPDRWNSEIGGWLSRLA